MEVAVLESNIVDEENVSSCVTNLFLVAGDKVLRDTRGCDELFIRFNALECAARVSSTTGDSVCCDMVEDQTSSS